MKGIKEKISEELKTNHQKYFKDNIQLNENLNNQVEEWRKRQTIREAQRDFFENKRKSVADFIIRLNFKINRIK